jgi:murein DD-endopeptidase MepM/ murein hydrolase activator NlpD
VVRSGNGVVVVDMDGDGSEQTGWNILYLHVAADGRVAKGEWVERDARIGHPSCEGGTSTGTHLHFDQGKMVKGDKVITADLYGQSLAVILREEDE